MARDGSGNYSLAAGNPVVTGTSISSTWANNTLNDVASALTQSVSKDGQTAMTGTLNMSGNAINNVTTVTANSFIPNSATIPTNGLYLSAANTLALSSNTTLRWSVNSTGNHVIAAPSSGTALTVNATNTIESVRLVTTGDVTTTGIIYLRYADVNGITGYAGFGGASASEFTVNNVKNGPMSFWTNNTSRVSIAAAGNVTINAPTSGVTLTGNAPAGINATVATWNVASATSEILHAFQLNSVSKAYMGLVGTAGNLIAGSAQNDFALRLESTNLLISTNAGSSAAVKIAAAGNVTINAPTSGVGLTVAGFAGTHSTKIQDSAGTALNVGYLEIPQNIQNAAYAPVLSDAGKHIYHSDGTARTYTIPANASVAYPIGTTLTFVNDASAGVNVTIAITTDTLYWAADGTTGSRTLARYGIATALKVAATRWSLSGTGIG